MLNKKLVIAALFAAVVAQDPVAPEEGAGGDPAAPEEGAGGDTPAAPEEGAGGDTPAPEEGAGGDTPAEGGDAPAEGGDAPAEGGDAPAEGGDAPAEGGDAPAEESDGDVPESKRAPWRTGDQDPAVALGPDDEVFCDHGEDALWEAARDRHAELKEAHEKAVEAVSAIENEEELTAYNAMTAEQKRTAEVTGYLALKQVVTDITSTSASHTSANAAILTDYDAAKEAVEELQRAASDGSDETTAKQTALDALTGETAAAEAAVATQRGRVESLVGAVATQAAQAAAWAERVEAATTAKGDADTAKTAATDALAEAVAQLTTRSWLLTVLGIIDSAQWAAQCEQVVGGSQNPICAWQEGSQTASTSTWGWNAANTGAVNGGTKCDISAVSTCTVMGVGIGEGAEAGLAKANTDALGVAADAAATPAVTATGLYLAYDNTDYTSAAGVSGVTTTSASALFLTYQKADLMAEAMKVACWKNKGSTNFLAGDEIASCGAGDTVTSPKKFNPIMQTAATSGTQASYAAASAAAKLLWVAADITDDMMKARAEAQVNLWYNGWIAAALRAESEYVGTTAQKALPACTGAAEDVDLIGAAAGATANCSSKVWSTTQRGTAEDAETRAVAHVAAMQSNLDSATIWKAEADADLVAANSDLTRATNLLQDLTEDIAPLARAEIDARNALAEAVAAQAARVIAGEKLGSCPTNQEPDSVGLTCVEVASPDAGATIVAATGARAVFEVAARARASVLGQQEFHDARVQWAEDNLAPVEATWEALVATRDELKTQLDTAVEMLANAKTACKVAAFGMAQAQLAENTLVAAARAAKAEEVARVYGGLAAMPTDGAVGTLCNIPRPVEGEPAGQRPECQEGEPGKPLCCGAAQRFLKDGTKLSIETCQLATATTYKYYPALPKDAVVQPTPETWRFQCISAAQKLAAAATAALAASYMMA